AGIFNIDVINDDYDFVCMSGHKGLYGPMGTGVLLINNRKLKPLLFGGTGTESIRKSQPEALPEKFESGTQNLNGIAGLLAGVNFVKRQGIDNLYRREYELASYLFENLRRMKNVSLYNDKFLFGKVAPVVSFNINNMYSEDVVGILDKYGICTRGGLHCSPLAHESVGTLDTGTVRVVPGAFNNRNEITRLISVIKGLSLKTT
ncbi:MAG: aminotransferase class V-fold PLP-dependent enzyme, partial [Ruminococcus sp.]